MLSQQTTPEGKRSGGKCRFPPKNFLPCLFLSSAETNDLRGIWVAQCVCVLQERRVPPKRAALSKHVSADSPASADRQLLRVAGGRFAFKLSQCAEDHATS
ncbi:hypothetical protein EYF80_041165 [Liparis tanakae]|uniref:Uncharacterized protein n=1 Tax=Liparis tanakae TaxID=230148 RepID=A0A4Z2G4W9_9TELE|nr:hypothetical protein EYF80_041165 [Liparis tanakae]